MPPLFLNSLLLEIPPIWSSTLKMLFAAQMSCCDLFPVKGEHERNGRALYFSKTPVGVDRVKKTSGVTHLLQRFRTAAPSFPHRWAGETKKSVFLVFHQVYFSNFWLIYRTLINHSEDPRAEFCQLTLHLPRPARCARVPRSDVALGRLSCLTSATAITSLNIWCVFSNIEPPAGTRLSDADFDVLRLEPVSCRLDPDSSKQISKQGFLH